MPFVQVVSEITSRAKFLVTICKGTLVFRVRLTHFQILGCLASMPPPV
jgi:hypothetical protein